MRNLINSRNVVSDPKNDMDFFELVAKAHIVVAIMKTFGMKIDDKPDENMFPSDTKKSSSTSCCEKNVNRFC